MGQGGFDLKRDLIRGQDATIGCGSLIILFDGFAVNLHLTHQFQHGLKEVDLQAQIGINGSQQGAFCLGLQPIIADGVPDDRPVLLLHVGLIVFLIGT